MSKSSKNIPEAYRIGDIPFLDCDIDLSFRPFIPRPETEYWVSEVIKQLNRTKPPPLPRGGARQGGGVRLHILDAFSGSGAIGIALLKNLPTAQVDFLEKDAELKKQILLNFQKNNVPKSRAKVIIGDVLEKIPKKKYDYIFANPPYIDPAKKHTIQKSVLDHEPHEALFAKDHGLYYIKHLITIAPKHLLTGGKMFIEFGTGQKRKIERTLRVIPVKTGIQGMTPNYQFIKDQYSRWRVLEISVE